MRWKQFTEMQPPRARFKLSSDHGIVFHMFFFWTIYTEYSLYCLIFDANYFPLLLDFGESFGSTPRIWESFHYKWNWMKMSWNNWDNWDSTYATLITRTLKNHTSFFSKKNPERLRLVQSSVLWVVQGFNWYPRSRRLRNYHRVSSATLQTSDQWFP